MSRAIIGWRVARERLSDNVVHRDYANGANGWTPDKRRAFLFTTCPQGGIDEKARGFNSGHRWAKAHARFLRHQWRDRATLTRIFVVRVRACASAREGAAA